MKSFLLLSPAKLNLYLKVINKRKDGYHNIKSIVQKIAFFDIIKVQIIPNKTIKKILFYNNNNIDPKNNTILKAINYFQSITNLSFGYEIIVKKNIPIEAGLGGGSSNAGVILKFLNNYFKKILSKNELIQIAKKVGADVPLFIEDATLLLIYGIGEKIKIIKKEDLKYKWFLLVIPDIRLSTKKVYEELNFVLTNFNKNIMEDSSFEIGINDLEKSAFKLYPDLREIKRRLKNCSRFVLMSGSGSTIYAGFENRSELLESYKNLSQKFKYKIIISRAL